MLGERDPKQKEKTAESLDCVIELVGTRGPANQVIGEYTWVNQQFLKQIMYVFCTMRYNRHNDYSASCNCKHCR